MKEIKRIIPSIAILFLFTACVEAGQPFVPPTPTSTSSSTPISASPTTRLATAASVPTAIAQQPTPTPTQTRTITVQSEILGKWKSSPHANTYDLGKGPNTYCSRCHSPQNWDPESKIDAPPNCVSCKFPTDATIRIAQGNPLVSPTDWKNIGCDVCHRLENGKADTEIAWFNKARGMHESVANATVLCEKCHTDTNVLRHSRDLGKSAHIGFQCTQCHDPHTTQASCTSARCHASVPRTAEHDATHANVNCVACHDASRLQVGFDNQGKTWVTWRTTEINGRKTTASYISHNLQKAVDCVRCHFIGNPWGLLESVGKTP